MKYRMIYTLNGQEYGLTLDSESEALEAHRHLIEDTSHAESSIVYPITHMYNEKYAIAKWEKPNK